jgi:glycosyltransferase involved in cell wall biosynthesis
VGGIIHQTDVREKIMKVGIEGSLFFKRSSGVGYYAKRLTEAAARQDSEIDFEIVRHWLPGRKFTPPIKPTAHLSYRLIKWFPPMVYYQVFKRLNWFLPYDLIALKNYDAFLFFNFIAFPVRKRTKSIVVIHDLSFIHFPQFTQKKNLKFTPKLTERSVRRASHIITVSENSKKEIVDYYKIPESMVSVIYNAIDHKDFYPRGGSEIKKVIKKYNLPERYIHIHGTIEPRKNIEGLLNAYAMLGRELQENYGLVISGGKGWNDESIYKLIDELKAAGHNIVLPGYIETGDLPAIYSGASLFVLPSFYEGFGVPPLEAMACGVPVIVSDNSSLPEVVGDAAIKIKAGDTEGLAKQMQRVFEDDKLAGRLRKHGLTQAAKFSWDESAARLVELLETL